MDRVLNSFIYPACVEIINSKFIFINAKQQA